MNPTQAAARAEEQSLWSTGLRIREVAQPSTAPLGQLAHASFTKVLRRVSTYLQVGWKWLEEKRTRQLASRRLRLAETISLGEKRSVSIVQVDGAQFLIGCSTGSVQLLAVLDKPGSGVKPASDSEGVW